MATEQVSDANAAVTAEQRGTDVRLITTPEAKDHHRNALDIPAPKRRCTDLRGGHPDRPQAGAEARRRERLRIEIPISEHLVVVSNADRPGVIGTIGHILGINNINIGGMQVARNAEGGQARHC